jgi:hypothetical protein
VCILVLNIGIDILCLKHYEYLIFVEEKGEGGRRFLACISFCLCSVIKEVVAVVQSVVYNRYTLCNL